MNRRLKPRRHISSDDFADLRKRLGLTRAQAAKELDVTTRTIQNWETGGARIPWMAYRMLRILRGYDLPGFEWEDWAIRQGKLISPCGRWFDRPYLEQIEFVFAQARLWRQMYSRAGCNKTASTVLNFPDRRRKPIEKQKPLEAQPRRFGGIL